MFRSFISSFTLYWLWMRCITKKFASSFGAENIFWIKNEIEERAQNINIQTNVELANIEKLFEWLKDKTVNMFSKLELKDLFLLFLAFLFCSNCEPNAIGFMLLMGLSVIQFMFFFSKI